MKLDHRNQKLFSKSNPIQPKQMSTELKDILINIEYKELALNFLNDKSINNHTDSETLIRPKKILNVKHEVKKIKIYDMVTNSLRYNQWSGLEVLDIEVDRSDKESVEFYNNMINKIQELMSKLIYKDWYILTYYII